MKSSHNIKFPVKLVYIISDTPHYIRASKCLPLFSEIFNEVHFIGCHRSDNRQKYPNYHNVFYHIDDIQLAHGYKSIRNVFAFLKYIKKNIEIINPDVVIATNEEYIIPFSIGYIKKPNFLICDLLDSISIRMMGFLRHFNLLWGLLSFFSKLTMDGMVEVTNERLLRHMIKPKNNTVIFNSPKWQFIEAEKNLPDNFIYVCGSTLDHISGVEFLLKAVENIPDVKIVFAGRAVGKWMTEYFLLHPSVVNLGEVSPLRSLSIAKSSLALFAHYKPFVINYVFAAPNKLFDSMMLGKYLLINSECKASIMAEKYGFGIKTAFGDSNALTNSIKKLLDNKRNNDFTLSFPIEEFKKNYSWELMEKQWISFFKQLNIPYHNNP